MFSAAPFSPGHHGVVRACSRLSWGRFEHWLVLRVYSVAKTLLDQLEEKVSDYVSRGVGYTSSKHSAAKRFLAWDIVQDVVVKFSQRPEREDLQDIFAYFLGSIDRE